MSKRTEDLAFKYNIIGSVDELRLFVSEVYADGFHDGKAFKDRHTALRDNFAGLAMQGMLSADPENRWSATDCAKFSYLQADAMLKAREVEL
jgi:uncharacterized protein YfaT (DUF1175 family)